MAKEVMLYESLAMCPWQATDGEGLQLWRLAVNILNKQFQTANNNG
jgi:hypothetical protein